MIQSNIPIVIVWFKRDLRLEDNEAINSAIASNKLVLLIQQASTSTNKHQQASTSINKHQILTRINK